MLIKGEDLTPKQRQQVLAAYVHRQHNTIIYPNGMRTPSGDEVWLKEHAFHFVKDGSRLSANRRYAEPKWKAERGAE